jgi:hypothetical protein
MSSHCNTLQQRTPSLRRRFATVQGQSKFDGNVHRPQERAPTLIGVLVPLGPELPCAIRAYWPGRPDPDPAQTCQFRLAKSFTVTGW